MVNNNLKFAREGIRQLRQHIAYSRWKNIHSAYMQHIIAAPQDAKAKTCPATTAWTGPQNADHIARSIAHQRLRFLEEVGIDQFTFRAIGDCQRLTAFRLNQLYCHLALSKEVQPLPRLAFR